MKKLMMAVGVVLVAGAAVAATSFAYQGVLRNEKGEVTGTDQAVIDFKLYTEQVDGTALWGRNVAVRLATNGLFNVELSDTAGTASVGLEKAPALDKVIETAQKGGLSLYIGLKVAGSAGEIRPRQKLIPTPMTAFAQNVAEAKGNFSVTSNATVWANLDVKGKVSATEMEVTKLTTASGTSATIQGGLVVTDGGAQVKGDVNVAGNFTVNGVNPGVPVGCIVMWSGLTTKIPDGWGICDGSQYGTVTSPDLRGRFIVGMNHESTDQDKVTHYKKSGLTDYTIGAAGGTETVTLTEEQMPKHKHHVGNGSDWWHCGVDDNTDYWFLSPKAWKGKTSPTGNSGHDSETDTNEMGGSAAHENRPPYYALCFIIKYQ